MSDHLDKLDWQVSITPVDGGIMTTDDLYMNLAPENGYMPSLTVDMNTASPDYQDVLGDQRYYFTSQNGQVYGALFVYYEPHRKDHCKITIEYKVNLNGSRNLAVSYNK